MHSGNLGLSQELETLFKASTHLQDVPDVELVFVGEGVKKPRLEAQVRALGLENVRFLPYQPKERLTESFASADVFIVSLKRGAGRLYRPEQALRHSRGGTALCGRGRGCL